MTMPNLRVRVAVTILLAVVTIARSETNAFLRLDLLDTQMKALQFAHASATLRQTQEIDLLKKPLAEYEGQKKNNPESYQIGDQEIAKEDIADYVMKWREDLEGAERDLRRVTADQAAERSKLQEQRAAALAACGYKDGVCEIHGLEMKPSEVNVSYGLLSPLPEEYDMDRLLLFRNSDAPLPGGCVGGPPRKPAALMLPVCPKCSAARRVWLKAHKIDL